MKFPAYLGPLSLIATVLFFWWGANDPQGRGYGLQMLFLLGLSVISGIALFTQASSKAERGIGWLCIGIPIVLVISILTVILSL